MAPVKDGVGQSEYTKFKSEVLKSILDMHLAITKAVLAKHEYFRRGYLYIDATSGPGLYGNKDDRFIGSPLVFLNSIEPSSDMKYRAHFIDGSPRNIRVLNWLLRDCPEGTVYVHQGNYEDVLPQILNGTDNNQLGLLYIDPNGIPDWEPIVDAVKRYSRLDVLIHISATSVKRVPDAQSLEEAMESLGKSHWLIRRPDKSDKNQWTFLFGSNTNVFGRYKKIQFFPLASPEAQEFFPRIALTRKEWERLGQATLWDMDSDS